MWGIDNVLCGSCVVCVILVCWVGVVLVEFFFNGFIFRGLGKIGVIW